MVSDLTARYLQCKVALDFVDKYLDSIDDALAKTVPLVPELSISDELCDTAEAVDFLRDNLSDLRKKIEDKLEENKKIASRSGDGDTAQVVYCKDCKYWTAMAEPKDWGRCTGFMAIFNVHAQWYCACGSKKVGQPTEKIKGGQ